MNKKWIVLIVVVVLIVGVAAYLVGKGTFSGGEKNLTNYTEGTTKYLGLAKSVVVKYDVLEGEVELGYKINQGHLELGMLSIDITLLNKSKRLIKQTEVDFRIINDQGKDAYQGYIIFYDLKPGETAVRSGYSMLPLDKLNGEPKKITLTLWKLWEDASPSPPKTTPTITPKTTVIPSPDSPSQVVKDFFQVFIDGRYDDLKKYLSSSDLKTLASVENGYQQWVEIVKQQNRAKPIERVEIIRESISGDKANMEYKVFYKNGSAENLGGNLIKEESGWKMVVWQK